MAERTGKNGVYDCNRLGGRTARVAPAVLPIIARAFVAPSLLSTPLLSLLLATKRTRRRRRRRRRKVRRGETRRENGRSGGFGERRQRIRERERGRERRTTTVGRYLSSLCATLKYHERLIRAQSDGVSSWRFYLPA